MYNILNIHMHTYIYTGKPPPGSRNRWFTGLLIYWFTGLLVWWFTGLLVYWFAGLLVYWFANLLFYWFSGLLGYWLSGILVYWLTDWLTGFTGLLVYWLTERAHCKNADILRPGRAPTVKMQTSCAQGAHPP